MHKNRRPKQVWPTDYQQKILALMADGLNAEKIGRKLGRTAKAIRQAKSRARKTQGFRALKQYLREQRRRETLDSRDGES